MVKALQSPKNHAFDYSEAFCRNRGLVSEAEQEVLRRTVVGIPGMGGVGGIHLLTLTRLGVGGFRLADGDRFEMANFNRQFGAHCETLGENKARVMAGQAVLINPNLNLEVLEQDLSFANLDSFLTGVHIVVDSLDAFALDTRRMLFMACHERGIPVVTAGPIGFSASLLVFVPGGMSYDAYFDYDSTDSPGLKMSKFIAGLCPDLRFLSYMDSRKVEGGQHRGPSVAPAVTLCAGFASVEVLKLVLRRGQVLPVPFAHYYDPYLGRFERKKVWWGNRNWLQRYKIRNIQRHLFP